MSINLEEIRERSVLTRDGFYHVVGVHYAIREADFNALVVEVEHLRGERAAVVTWLRDCDKRCREHDGRENAVSETYCKAADAIERGDHHREEEP